MNEDRFWEIIEDAEGEAALVTAALAELPPEEIVAWQKIYASHFKKLHKWKVWGAMYMILAGADDNFDAFKAWIIGKGRETYQAAVKNADTLGPFVTDDDVADECDNEPLNFAAEEAYKRVTKKPLPDGRGIEDFGDPSGDPFDEDEAERLYPRLAALFC